VSCDSSVCMGLPIKGPMFDRLVCACSDGYLGILLSLARRPVGKCFMQDGFCRPTFGWVKHKPQVFFRLVTCRWSWFVVLTLSCIIFTYIPFLHICYNLLDLAH
jgi:hypothetical protein